MDKLDFVKKAPFYYVAGIVLGIVRLQYPHGTSYGPYTLDLIAGSFDENDDYFRHEILCNKAITILKGYDVIVEFHDDLGPTLYGPFPSLSDWWNDAGTVELHPVFERVKQGGVNWLKQALFSVNRSYEELGIRDEDFQTFEESEWEPIPVDRNDPALQQADEAIKEMIEAAEGDNGYAVHAPDERDYVISNLKSFCTFIQQQKKIYAPQVKAFVLAPLGRVVARFGKASLGLTAEAAKKAVFDWIKSHLGKLLELLS